MKKNLIYLFLFLFFYCLLVSSLKANPTFVDGTVIDGDPGGVFAEEEYPTGLTFNNDGTKMFIKVNDNESEKELSHG